MFSGLSAVLPLLCLIGGAVALPAQNANSGTTLDLADDVATGSVLPGRWYHEKDATAHALFRRDGGGGSAEVGSPTWSSAYPSSTPDSSSMPQAWKDALNAAVQAGKIPDIDPSTQASAGADPTYDGTDPTDPSICSATYQCRIDGQVWDAPDGAVGLGFDDGPLPPSDNLYSFLQKNDLHATHFFIGVNILNNWQQFLTAFQTNGDDIAVHTWTHPYMTTLSNEDVVAQLGWTIQIIYDSTGGKVPAYWRPPYGDTDTRVTAIAKEVFGLTAVMWNHDTNDWQLGDGSPDAATPDSIQSNFQKWLSGSKSPGLIVLEHELTDASVQAFMSAYPLMTQYDWTLTSIAQLNGGSAWQSSSGGSNGSFPLPSATNDDSKSFLASGVASISTSTNSSSSTNATSATSSTTSTSHAASASASGNSSTSNQHATSGAYAVGVDGKMVPVSMVVAAAGLLAGLVL